MKHIELPQGPLRYLDTGSGPTLVFVHGLAVDHQLWAPVIERLAPDFRCIAPDWPFGSHRLPMHAGADLSPGGAARLVADFLEALELEDVTLVGNDTGGVISQLATADHGQRVGRLVLTNCDALEVLPPEGFGHLLVLPRIPGAMAAMAQLLARFPALRRHRRAYGALTVEPLPGSLLADWCAPGAAEAGVRRDAGKLLRGMSPAVTLAVAERLGRSGKPVLLAWGARDPFFTVDLARRLAARLPGAELELIDGGGVFVPLDRPAEVAEAIAGFAAGASRAAVA